jgi:hypothetical protein
LVTQSQFYFRIEIAIQAVDIMKENKNVSYQNRDTGLALLLILLLLIYFAEMSSLLLPAIIVLIAVMTWPAVFSPLSRFWFSFSFLLGNVFTKIILTIVFMVMVVPVGIVRRLMGADAMRHKAWKNGDASAFVKREYLYSKKDLEKPY